VEPFGVPGDATNPFDAVRGLAFGSGGTVLLGIPNVNGIGVYDVSSGAAVEQPLLSDRDSSDITVDESRTLVATANGFEAVAVYELDRLGEASLRPVAELDVDSIAVALDADGERVAAGAINGDVVVAEIPATDQRTVLRGHTDRVNGVAFARGTYLISASQDGRVLAWDLESGGPPVTLIDTGARIERLSVSRDRFAVATLDGRVLLGSLEVLAPADQVLELARSRVTRELTPEERDAFGF
jgi:WD40 repeat protein